MFPSAETQAGSPLAYRVEKISGVFKGDGNFFKEAAGEIYWID